MTTQLWDHETFLENLRAIGTRAYHDKHPFHVAMNEGRLSQEALRGWVANRFYYQQNIPIKDATILSNCPLRQVRRIWIHRIFDHDGTGENEGGIEAWLCARSNLSATYFGPSSTRFITRTVPLKWKLRRLRALLSQDSPEECGCKPIPPPGIVCCCSPKASSN